VEENVLSAVNFLLDECIGWHELLAVDGALPVWWIILIFPIVFHFKSTLCFRVFSILEEVRDIPS
jgi:hypothetical protein